MSVIAAPAAVQSPSTSGALARLRELSAEEASGELIAAGEGREIHVFIQGGRLAWGMCDESRFAFRRYLLEGCGVDGDTMREVVAECRRTGAPFGQTLTDWGLVTPAQVREGLLRQVAEALGSLDRIGDVPTVFLRRESHFAGYDPTLTFHLGEVEARLQGVRSPSGEAPKRIPSVDGDPLGNVLLAEMLDGSSEVVDWAAIVRDESILAASATVDEREALGRVLAEIAPTDDVDYVALRSGGGTVLGFGLPGSGSRVWCGLSEGVTLGSVLSSLGHASLSPDLPESYEDEPWVEAEGPEGYRLSQLEVAQGALDQVLAVIVTDADGRPAWMARRECYPLADLLSAARAGVTGVPSPRWAEQIARSTGSSPTAATTGYESVLVARPEHWYLASDVPGTDGRRVVLAMSRRASQGYGWALLSAVVRWLSGSGAPEPIRPRVRRAPVSGDRAQPSA